jgi:hypothetical protein
LLVNGQLISAPATVPASAQLAIHLAFSFPDGVLDEGHVFIVKNGETTCLDDRGRPFDNPGITEGDVYRGETSTDWPLDPALFLNGEGAPYFVEISNGCGTHSNRLPLDIVTVESE